MTYTSFRTSVESRVQNTEIILGNLALLLS